MRPGNRKKACFLCSTSSSTFFSILSTEQIDAVVLDYQTPGMNGHNLAAAIRKCRPKVPIVMFSASEIPKETYKLVDAVVPKTDTIRQLLPTVAKLCDTSSPS